MDHRTRPSRPSAPRASAPAGRPHGPDCGQARGRFDRQGPASGLATGKKRLRATFANRLAAGKYTVSWRVKADDDDTETGTFGFTVR